MAALGLSACAGLGAFLGLAVLIYSYALNARLRGRVSEL